MRAPWHTDLPHTGYTHTHRGRGVSEAPNPNDTIHPSWSAQSRVERLVPSVRSTHALFFYSSHCGRFYFIFRFFSTPATCPLYLPHLYYHTFFIIQLLRVLCWSHFFFNVITPNCCIRRSLFENYKCIGFEVAYQVRFPFVHRGFFALVFRIGSTVQNWEPPFEWFAPFDHIPSTRRNKPRKGKGSSSKPKRWWINTYVQMPHAPLGSLFLNWSEVQRRWEDV